LLESLRRAEILIGSNIPFYKGDVSDKSSFSRVFEQFSVDGVIHFAGFKAVVY
jgi:UDP-glucose 4-epimerase